MPNRTPPETEEGLCVSHLILRIDPAGHRKGQDSLRKRADQTRDLLEKHARGERFDLLRLVSDRNDFMTVYFAETLREIDRFQRRFLQSPLGSALTRTYSFLSLTELSLYQPPEQRVREQLRGEGLEEGSPEYEEAYEEKMQRMEHYKTSRLRPEIPDRSCATFYPMLKRRSSDGNWYQLPREKRAELMASHGRVGRKYAGDIQQIITSCVGIDDWEWGVTLYADDPRHLKQVVYEMRFDEVSAVYSDFGPFFTGYRIEPSQLPSLFDTNT